VAIPLKMSNGLPQINTEALGGWGCWMSDLKSGSMFNVVQGSMFLLLGRMCKQEGLLNKGIPLKKYYLLYEDSQKGLLNKQNCPAGKRKVIQNCLTVGRHRQ
jgi:hypothetical protein